MSVVLHAQSFPGLKDPSNTCELVFKLLATKATLIDNAEHYNWIIVFKLD